MIRAALILAAPLALCACANSPLSRTYQAQAAYEQSVADYRACLAANPNNVTACDAKRASMHAQEQLWTELRCTTLSGAPRCGTPVNANVSIEQR